MGQKDLIVIGAGPGGYVAAIRAARLGKQVALVEEGEVGGTCLNRGCIPTKSLLHSAGLYREAREGGLFGVTADGLRYDPAVAFSRKDAVVSQMRTGIEGLLRQNKVELIRGKAVILAPGKVKVGEEELEGEKLLIASGSVPALPPIAGIELALTSDDLLEKPLALETLTIIGGGVIGVEFASYFAALGKQVTIIEALERILPPFDREISQNLQMILKKQGVKIVTGARVEELSKAEDGKIACRYSTKDGQETVISDGVLCAVGRRARTERLLADGVELQMERGRIVVDSHFETSLPGIYAIGDVIGGIQLAHAASAQGTAAVEEMFGFQRSVNLDVIPSCVYTTPEIASVGMTADEAKAQGIAVKSGKFLLTASGRSLIENSERSFVKVVFDAGTGKALGAQLMCPRATDLIGELASAVVNGLTLEEMTRVVHPHPTFCEAVAETAEAAEGRSVHSAPPRR